MFSPTLTKGFNESRLKVLLAVFFLALAIPTGILIWQAWSQLKWEAFHQYRGLAEELTGRIDDNIAGVLRTADERSFADYVFLNVTGDSRFNVLQRSPLSAFPVPDDLPGLIGHFQVDTDGNFSTPLLPPDGTSGEQLGIGASELSDRQELARRIESILSDHRLVRTAPVRDLVSVLEDEAESLYATEPGVSVAITASRQRSNDRATDDALDMQTSPAAMAADEILLPDSASQERNRVRNPAAATAADFEQERTASADSIYTQQVFDLLNIAQEPTTGQSAGREEAGSFNDPVAGTAENFRYETIGKVSELKLDADLQAKSEIAELAAEEQRKDNNEVASPGRAKRREQIALPEAASPADREGLASAGDPAGLRINTFESEIDPLEFSQLGSGHFVLFRNVWRSGERFVQGFLVDREAFVSGAIEKAFRDSAVASMSNLIVGYEDEVIGVYAAADSQEYTDNTGALRGALLFRSRLSAPLDRLEMIFSVSRLPQGPGATVLAWVTIVLGIVFAGGFLTMYRLGLSQLKLARQQQDFVSAVSHELKTPLTSIRMYGEMLKEGWADDAKRQEYYEFIHDESERLTRMITNVLQLAKITRNEPSFDCRPIKVGELMSNIESKIATQVERAGFTLEFRREQGAEDAVLNIDADCFAQIVINLVDNAIKFSKNAESKLIEVGCKLTGGNQLLFSIRDYGPGIPKDQLKKIFRLFYRTESELTRETVGTGIGLAIVHQLAVAMHGHVDVINCDPGAEFRLRFPVTVDSRR